MEEKLLWFDICQIFTTLNTCLTIGCTYIKRTTEMPTHLIYNNFDVRFKLLNLYMYGLVFVVVNSIPDRGVFLSAISSQPARRRLPL